MDTANLSDSPRLAALACYGIAGTPPEPAYDDLAALARQICETSQAYVTIVDAEQVWFKAALGVESRGVPREASICPLMLETRAPLEIPDTTLDPRTRELAAVTEGGLRFYSGVPLVTPDGHVLGSLCVADTRLRELSTAQRESLILLGRQAAARMEARRQAAELRAAEWLARSAIEVGGGAPWVVDVARGTAAGDARLALWFNIPVDRCHAGEPIASYLAAIHEEDRALVENALEQSTQTGAPYNVEFRAVDAHGTTRWFHSLGRPEHDISGVVTRMPGMILNITVRRAADAERAQSAARLRIATEAAQLGIFVWNVVEDQVSWENERVYRQFGRTPDDGAINAAEFADKIVHPEDRPGFEAAVGAALGGYAPFFFQGRFFRKDGALRWIELHGQLTRDAAGTPLWMLGTTADITVPKEAEASLREAKEQAECASRAKDDFLAALSHELRTPLTPVLMTAAALREDERLPAEVREQLGMMERNIALEARLIDDLLDLTRISRGKLQLRAAPCDANSLLALAAEVVRDEAREKQVAFQWDLAAVRSHLTGDPARLQQVFWNLLRNAVKFTPGGGTVRIRSADTAGRDEDSCLLVEVSDTGIGFAPSAAERLFEPFEQAGREGDHRFGGLGLGLAIARAIVELHGGTIRAASEGAGRGATFTVELPGAVMPPPALVPPGPGDQPAKMKNEPPMRLLVVEDHVPTLTVLSRLLVRAGHTVVAAETLAAARAAADAHTFDAVVSDLGLPDGTGLELMAELRARHGLHGVVLSGYGMEDDLRRSHDAGFVAHLVKPVDFTQLRHALREIVAPLAR